LGQLLDFLEGDGRPREALQVQDERDPAPGRRIGCDGAPEEHGGLFEGAVGDRDFGDHLERVRITRILGHEVVEHLARAGDIARAERCGGKVAHRSAVALPLRWSGSQDHRWASA
jgi:hypothetical protein